MQIIIDTTQTEIAEFGVYMHRIHELHTRLVGSMDKTSYDLAARLPEVLQPVLKLLTGEADTEVNTPLNFELFGTMDSDTLQEVAEIWDIWKEHRAAKKTFFTGIRGEQRVLNRYAAFADYDVFKFMYLIDFLLATDYTAMREDFARDILKHYTPAVQDGEQHTEPVENLSVFAQSELADFKTFSTLFEEQCPEEEYRHIDLFHYHQKVKAYSMERGNSLKKADWMGTVLLFIHNDSAKNELKVKLKQGSSKENLEEITGKIKQSVLEQSRQEAVLLVSKTLFGSPDERLKAIGAVLRSHSYIDNELNLLLPAGELAKLKQKGILQDDSPRYFSEHVVKKVLEPLFQKQVPNPALQVRLRWT